MNVKYRQARDSDIKFLLNLRRNTMDEHLQKVGGCTDEQSHLNRVLYRFDAAKIVLIENSAAGLLKSYCNESGWVIVQVQVLPEYQGRGLGSKMVKGVLEQARSDDQSVSLSVLKGNPAKELYSRLGFTVVSQSEAEYKMCFYPNQKIKLDS